ncbi:MAG TPA: MerC domain-containing protein [Marmoricola sp.]|nr:MerC domain-containing protein [Marmoricola sp.]
MGRAGLWELLIFSFFLPIGLWGVVQAFRRDRTWIAGALVFVAASVFSIVTTLRGYALMGSSHYGIDPRVPRRPATPTDVVLALVAALVPVLAWLAVRARSRRQDRP